MIVQTRITHFNVLLCMVPYNMIPCNGLNS
jgi:hypothetical protein